MKPCHPSSSWVFLMAILSMVYLPHARASDARQWQSYAPLRPLPVPSNRSLGEGPAYYVDAARGDDANSGAKDSPWKSIKRAMEKLGPADTLILRGGTFYEAIEMKSSGRADAPITLRAYPGELVIIDGGFREFFENPASAWEPYPGGGEGEYRSVKSYSIDEAGGNFGDSMVPLRIYGSFVDLRATSEYEVKDGKGGVYVGPGVKWDEQTRRIHIRLSHTTLEGLGKETYRGETDPRKMPLVISGDEAALKMTGAKHVRVQDIVVRGCSTSIKIFDSEGIEFDGLTLYTMKYGMIIGNTRDLKVVNSFFRGFDAPWHPRSSGTDVDCFCPLDLVTASSGRNFEFAYNEFTDHHDCIQIGDVESLTFHHNLVDRFNDDGIDIDRMKPLGTAHVFQNRISRCLTPISIHRAGEDLSSENQGLYIYRNIFDLRKGTYSQPPSSSSESAQDQDLKFSRPPVLARDHGRPVWPSIYFYHNTVLQKGPPFRGYYGSAIGYSGVKQTRRRVFNNVFVFHNMFEDPKKASIAFPQISGEADLQLDGNLFWGLLDSPMVSESPFVKFQKSRAFEESKKQYPTGWTAHDLHANPGFNALDVDVRKSTDLTLGKQSPAANAGIAIPAAWPDPLRERDRQSPDIGAIPVGVLVWMIGPHGSLPLCP